MAGVVVLERENKQVVFSHHGSDPLGDGNPHDAFDVMRILECNGDYKQAFDKARETLGFPPFDPNHYQQTEDKPLEWDDIQPLPPARPEAPTLPPEMLPEPLRSWLSSAASRACLPLEMFASAALVALSGLIGRTVSIKPLQFSDWEAIPNLWGCVIAPPGSIKSDTTNEAFRPIHKLEQEAREAFEQATEDNEAEKMILEAQLAKAKSSARNNKVTKEDLRDLMQQLKELKALTRTRFITQDSTVEKLGVLLQDNP